MKTHVRYWTTLTCAFIISTFYIRAQDIQEISVGAGYNKQAYINLAAGTQKQVDNSSWDIGFTVFGFQDAGVFINESAGTVQGQPQAVIGLYDAGIADFAEVPDTSLFFDFPLFNSEESWSYGAFNEGRNPANPFDFGWGLYNPQNNMVTGERIFVVELRNGNLRKFQITQLQLTTYTFRHANLDGSNEVTVTINKADHPGKTLAYYSFTTNSTVDVEDTAPFDLSYNRYITKLWDPGSMTYIDYQVTGIFSGNGAETAKADGIDPATVTFAEFADSLSSRVDIIGHDWKTFTGGGWSLDDDRVYFLRASDDHVWKLQFIDFEGSSTGNAVFEKTDLGIISSVTTPESAGIELLVYPNPTTSQLYVALDRTVTGHWTGQLQAIDITGRSIHRENIRVSDDFQVIELNTDTWAPGQYFLRLVNDHQMIPLSTVVRL